RPPQRGVQEAGADSIWLPGVRASVEGAPLRPGEPVWLAARPGEMTIRREPDGGAAGGAARGGTDGWRGEVGVTAWTGEDFEAEVRFAGSETIVRVTCEPDAGAPLRRGEAVRLVVRGGSGLVYAREG
ncbi:MAG: TOBE domain-containing protein, partial [bacterium]|nr:TOBE domain-containing protein [bacterium]